MIRIQNMILWIIFRSAVFAFMVFWLAFYNGISGHQAIETFIYAMINVNLTNFAVTFYAVFEIDVSFRKYGYSLEAEENLPAPMSKLYRSSFREAKQFLRTYISYIIYSLISSAFIYYVYKAVLESGGTMGSDGKSFGLFTYGIIAPHCQVIQHHAQVGFNVRNWGVIYTLIFLFSIG